MAIRQPKPILSRSGDGPSRYDGVRMSEAEFLALPEEKPYLEYIDGRAEQKPMVNADHGRVVGELDGWFFLYKRANGGDLGPERRVRLTGSGDYQLPDAAFWAAGIPSGDDTVPTVAVEVRSPNQSLPKLRKKCLAYLADGSTAAWLIDPDKRTVEVFEGSVVRTLKTGDSLTCEAMPGFELPLAEPFSVLDR